ncbi:hypothetical protein AURDEDRAFT_127486 [Auricularia subglabra TFB-10046 SS5]|nr:hypothetical protein AURDEDRAFT_127486 [Auricularia subglabra TFB-10046 SS5]
MRDVSLQAALEGWTRQATRSIRGRPPRVPDSAVALPVQGEHVATGPEFSHHLGKLRAVLTAEAQRLNQRTPLGQLPQAILRRVCAHLELWDIVQLSHASRDIRSSLLDIPEAWCNIYVHSTRLPWRAIHIRDDNLRAFAQRAGSIPLQVSLYTTQRLFLKQAPVLADLMGRLESLRIHCIIGTHLPAFLSALCVALESPAPCMTIFHLSFVESGHGGVGPGYLSQFDDLGVPTAPPSNTVSVTWRQLPAGNAPRLQSCQLTGVRLPELEDCGAFQNVTVFSYCLSDEICMDLQHVFSAMPRLHSLSLSGYIVPSTLAALEEAASAISVPASLRTLMLTDGQIDCAALARSIPLRQLSDLWLEVIGPEHFALLAATFPAMDGLSLCSCEYRLAGVLAGATCTTVTFTLFPSIDILSSMLLTFSSITWLTMHEPLWDIDLLGLPPTMPAVRVLCVRLASCADYECGNFEYYGAAGITASVGFAWPLPALREVRVTAPSTADRAACRASPACLCAPPLRISLHDIAWWIRHGIAFDAEKLEHLLLFGMAFVDADICAGWDEVHGLCHTIDASDIPDVNYRSISAAMDFKAHHDRVFT